MQYNTRCIISQVEEINAVFVMCCNIRHLGEKKIYFQPVISAQKREAVAAFDFKTFDGITVAGKRQIEKL
jgi:hypothetical protein